MSKVLSSDVIKVGDILRVKKGMIVEFLNKDLSNADFLELEQIVVDDVYRNCGYVRAYVEYDPDEIKGWEWGMYLTASEINEFMDIVGNIGHKSIE